MVTSQCSTVGTAFFGAIVDELQHRFPKAMILKTLDLGRITVC